MWSVGGGYAATICGILMNVKRVFSISGQMNLFSLCNKENPLLLKGMEGDSVRYYDIERILGQIQNLDTRIYYLYAYFCDQDREQSELVRDNHIIKLAFDSKKHGKILSGRGYVNLLTAGDNDLSKFVSDNEGKIIDKDSLV